MGGFVLGGLFGDSLTYENGSWNMNLLKIGVGGGNTYAGALGGFFGGEWAKDWGEKQDYGDYNLDLSLPDNSYDIYSAPPDPFNLELDDSPLPYPEIKLPAVPTKEQLEQTEKQTKINNFIAIAEQELKKGFKEKNGNNMTPYGKWYGLNGQPWCAMFVSWSANQANILGTIVPKYASVLYGKTWYQNKGNYKSRESGYTPKAGDIIFLKRKGQRHTGIVLAFDPKTNTVYTIEGNSSDSVNSRNYKLSDTYIEGYGVNGGTNVGQIPGSSTSGTDTKIQ